MAGTTKECVVQRATGYTVMSNYHLRDKALGLKAKGLLSVMLSLPEDWDYTIAGLASILGEGKHVIRTAVQELEKAGYITRQQLAGEGGKFGGNQYVIRELPEAVDAPLSNFPTTEKPMTENPMSENCTELNKDKSITKENIPPVSPEIPEPVKSKRKRGRKPTVSVLDDKAMEEMIRRNVASLGDTNGWSRDDKNAVYRLVLEFYGPRECNGSPPAHTSRGVNGLFRNLAKVPRCTGQEAAEMLLTAIERGWTGVYPKETRDGGAAAPPKKDDLPWL